MKLHPMIKEHAIRSLLDLATLSEGQELNVYTNDADYLCVCVSRVDNSTFDLFMTRSNRHFTVRYSDVKSLGLYLSF